MARQLYRSRKNRFISGVAGGIAEYFDIDPVIVRIFFVVATLAWGASIIIYAALWILVPDEIKIWEQNFRQGKTDWDKDIRDLQDEEDNMSRKEKRKSFGGIILVVFGAILLFDNLFSWFDFGMVFPLLMLAAGIYLLLRTPHLNKNIG